MAGTDAGMRDTNKTVEVPGKVFSPSLGGKGIEESPLCLTPAASGFRYYQENK